MMMEGSAPAPPQPDQLPAPGGTAGAAPRRHLKRSTRIALTVILIVAVIAAAGVAVSYFLNARNYVSTDNAQVDGDKITINAPTSGTLQDWRITQGSVIHQGEIVGRIKIINAFEQPLMTIRAPIDGTVAVDNGVVGTYVTTGTQLAVAYNLDHIYVTARVDVTDIKPVRVWSGRRHRTSTPIPRPTSPATSWTSKTAPPHNFRCSRNPTPKALAPSRK
jgi:biotin carboxyl carrier protein